MKSVLKTIVSFILLLVLTVSSSFVMTVHAEETLLSNEQRNAIAMLNYITVLTQDINSSKNSRLYMEEAYSTLINNTYPNAVDSRTLNQMTGLLDTMENYRMINVKRDRLQYIYEQNQAQAIRAAIPNPLGLISTIHSFSPAKLIASIVYMAVDSYTSYTSYTAEADLQYLKDGWALDDEEAAVLHESRKGTFSYMVKMVNDYGLPGDLTLTEGTVEEFVNWKNNNNVVGRIQFLEANKKTYQSYGGYWLELAESYYANEDYLKCIEAVSTYEAMGTRIFRRDYELAKVLPLAIAAAKEEYPINMYAPYASERARTIVENTNHDDWALRYFAAQTLVDLYAETKERAYLEEAYSITLNNTNYLVSEQRDMNSAYLSKVQEAIVPKGSTKEEKKQIENYNKMLKEMRKTELPPVYEPLLLNCELLYAISDELGISNTEKVKIDRMLHLNGDVLFLTKPIDDLFWFYHDSEALTSKELEFSYGGTTIFFPAAYLTKNALITVSITESDSSSPVVFTDWMLDVVKRETGSNIDESVAVFSSSMAKQYKWVPESVVTIDIIPKEGIDISYHFEFKTTGTKNVWYDYAQIWKGHKNHWYDYAKVWENSVEFMRVN